jgi:hypothetical protein
MVPSMTTIGDDQKGVAASTTSATIEQMFDATETRDEMGAWVAELEPGVFSGEDALALLRVVCDLKRLSSAAETLLAARIAETEAWRADGADRTAAHWLARRAGTSIAEAKAKLETAEQLDKLPATAAAFRAGRLSDQQARAVVEGAVADPQSEKNLLDTAAGDSLKELRNASRRAQAVDDGEGRQREIHERRSLRARVDPDGTFRLSFRGTALAGSRILAALKPFTTRAFNEARKHGRFESSDAYAADGLVAMADAAAGGEGKPRSNVKVIVVVDIEALRRGEVEHGETCEIRGVGPVSVATARELLGDAALAVVIKDGVDVKNVTHLARRTTAHQRTALEFWGIRCEVKGCDSTDFVDVHHVFEYARSRHTRLDELRVSCKHHHRREHKGWKPTDDQLRTRDRGSPDQELPLSA